MICLMRYTRGLLIPGAAAPSLLRGTYTPIPFFDCLCRSHAYQRSTTGTMSALIMISYMASPCSLAHPPYDIPRLFDQLAEFRVSAVQTYDQSFDVVVFAPDLTNEIFFALNCGIEFSVDHDAPPSERNRIDPSTVSVICFAEIVFSMFAARSAISYTSTSLHSRIIFVDNFMLLKIDFASSRFPVTRFSTSDGLSISVFVSMYIATSLSRGCEHSSSAPYGAASQVNY
jgi:hypothetical protein